jgi:hypothetical protein
MPLGIQKQKTVFGGGSCFVREMATPAQAPAPAQTPAPATAPAPPLAPTPAQAPAQAQELAPESRRSAQNLLAIPLVKQSSIPRGPWANADEAKKALQNWTTDLNTGGGAFQIMKGSRVAAATSRKGTVLTFTCERTTVSPQVFLLPHSLTNTIANTLAHSLAHSLSLS